MTATQLKIKELLGQLITRETGLTDKNDPQNFAIARDYALKKFKTHTFHRTNQFDVISRLRGLEEKFRILNREDLADALQVRIDQLPVLGSDQLPEILHVILELSDEPLKKALVSDLDKLVKPPPPPELTWGDIIADEPLDGDIWTDVDFGAESSDAWSDDGGREMREPVEKLWEGDAAETMRSKRRKKRKEGGLEDEDEERYRVVGVEGFTMESDREGLETMKAAQYWERKVEAVSEQVDVSLSFGPLEDLWVISELQALREVIMMIFGYYCELFENGKGDDENVVWVDSERVEKRFALRHASHEGFVALLEWFAARGTSLNRIRKFTKAKEDLPERQAFMAAVEEKLVALDREVIAIEEQYVGTGNVHGGLLVHEVLIVTGPSVSVSLLSLQTKLEPLLRPFTTLSKIIENEKTAGFTHSSHLEQLYQAACDLQSTGDMPSFHFTATIFFSCLQTYLRPIRLWMESGLLPPPSTDFLVVQNQSDAEVELGSLWQSQFSLRRSPSGALDAPSFVHPVAGRILTTGKSVVFLKRLQPSTASEFSDTLTSSDELSFTDVCTPGASLAPFSSLFLVAFNTWISARHHSVSSRLRTHLFTACGLWHSLDALDTLYFGANGALAAALAQGLFDRLDRRTANWADRFVLTELAQGVFAGTPSVDAARIRLALDPAAAGAHRASRTARAIPLLSAITLHYRLPWPIQNILTPRTSLPLYQKISTFLLQLRRARYLLTHLALLRGAQQPATYHTLRHRLLWFTSVLTTYVTTLVLRPQTAALRTAMREAADLDEMARLHARFIERARDQCLLGARLAPIHAAVVQALDLASRFAYAQAEPYNGSSSGGGGGDGGRRGAALPFLPTPKHLRRRRRGSESSADEELPSPSAASSTAFGDDEGEEEGDSEEEGMGDEERRERELAKMLGELGGLVGFVRDGLRGVARAGVMPHLEMLAEGLEGYGGADGGAWWEGGV
ncbi:Spc98 family-domain-containing protein [Geopyxis carbonaria]|nr:Spc98 family-domain-containing protein [Geopyxis carbonaria]